MTKLTIAESLEKLKEWIKRRVLFRRKTIARYVATSSERLKS